jgi:hypothetical protein
MALGIMSKILWHHVNLEIKLFCKKVCRNIFVALSLQVIHDLSVL